MICEKPEPGSGFALTTNLIRGWAQSRLNAENRNQVPILEWFDLLNERLSVRLCTESSLDAPPQLLLV